MKKISQQMPPDPSMMGTQMSPPSGVQQQPPSQEEQIIGIIQQKISNEYPYMMKYIKDISLVDKKEGSLSYVYAVNLESEAGEFIAPVYVVNGIIKPISLLFSKSLGMFVPNSENWMKLTDSVLAPQLGDAAKTPKDLKTDVDVRNLVIPPTTGRYSYASDPDLVLYKIAAMSPEEKRGLIHFFTKNEDILAKMAEVYGEENLKSALSYNNSDRPINKSFEIISSFDNDNAKNRYYFNSIARNGYAIKDNRKEVNNKAVVIENPEYYFQINQPGTYRIWTDEGIKDVIVGTLVDDNTVYLDRLNTLIPTSVSDYGRIRRELNNEFLPIGNAEDNKPGYFILDTDKNLMIVDPDIREIYTAIKILDPYNIKKGLISELFNSIHDTNIDKLSLKDVNKGKSTPDADSILFISIAPNGSIFGLVVDRINNIFKDKDTIVISVNPRFTSNSNIKTLVYDPEISGNNFKAVSNGHETVIILPINVKFIKIKKAEYNILDGSRIDKSYKALIERLGGTRISERNINDNKIEPTKTASAIIDIATEYDIPVDDVEYIKIAVANNIASDIYAINDVINNILYKFAAALNSSDSDGATAANFILHLPEVMNKIGQAAGQMMAGAPPPSPFPQGLPGQPGSMPPPPPQPGQGELLPPDMQSGMMPPGGAPDITSILDKYINEVGDKVKNLLNKADELKNTLSILMDIKANSGTPPAPGQEDIANLMRESGEISNDAFNAAAILGTTTEEDFEKNIMVYMPHILKGIDSVGRIISELNLHSAEIANKYGEKTKNSLEDKANRVFKQLGDFYTFLRGAKITRG